MTRDQLIALIGTLLGGLGIGSWVTKWLEARSERKRWLRDQRRAAYSALAAELLSAGIGSEVKSQAALSAITAEVRLLLDDQRLAHKIDTFFDDVQQTKQRLHSVLGTYQTSGDAAKLEEWKARSQAEDQRLKHGSREIVDALRKQLLRQ